MKRIALIALALLTLVAVAFIWSRQRALRSWTLDWKKGDRLVYALRYAATGSSHQVVSPNAGLAQSLGQMAGQKLRVELEGQLLYEVLAVEEGTARLRFQIQAERLALEPEGLRQAISPEALTGEIEIDEKGHILNLSLPQRQLLSVGFILSDLLALSEVPFPQNASSEWTSTEQGPTPGMGVSWKVLARGSDSIQLVKTYASERVRELQIEGMGEISLDPDSLQIVKLQTHRQRRMMMQSQTFTSDETDISLVRLASDRFIWKVPPSAEPEQKIVKDQLNGQRSRALIELEMQERELQGLSAAQVLELLRNADPNDHKAMVPTYLKVKALIALFPDQTATLRSFLTDYPISDERFGAAATALSSVGHAEAQALLRDVLAASDSDPQKQQQLIPHLAFVKQPERASEDLLRQLSETDKTPAIRDTARLGLGTLAGIIKQEQAQRAEAIMNETRQRLEASESEESRELELRVLGNIGLDQQLAIVAPFLDPKQSLSTQAVALQALRFVDTLEARSILLRTLQTSPNDRLREAAGEALQFTPGQSSDLPIYRRILFSERNIAVLKFVLQASGKLIAIDPEAIKLLQDFTSACGRTEVCAYATGVLESSTSGSP